MLGYHASLPHHHGEGMLNCCWHLLHVLTGAESLSAGFTAVPHFHKHLNNFRHIRARLRKVIFLYTACDATRGGRYHTTPPNTAQYDTIPHVTPTPVLSISTKGRMESDQPHEQVSCASLLSSKGHGMHDRRCGCKYHRGSHSIISLA